MERIAFQAGDLVTRDGTDVQRIKHLNGEDGHTITVVCIRAPHSGWCKVGDEESNLASRYGFAGPEIDNTKLLASV